MRKRSNRSAIIGPGKGTRPHCQIQTTKAVNRNQNCSTDFLITLNVTDKKVHQYIKHSTKIQTKIYILKMVSESDLYWLIQVTANDNYHHLIL